MPECKRLRDETDVGPTCSCHTGVCVLEVNAPSSRPDCPRCGSPGASFSTHPCNPPDTRAQEHVDTSALAEWVMLEMRDRFGDDFRSNALDALLAHVERLTAERDEARKWHALHVSELEHRYLRERGRAEAAERERDNAKDALERMRQELVRVDGLNRAAEALAERRGSLAEMAWVIIANAGEGNWDTQTDDWRAAAVKWRDEFHAALADGDGAAT